MWSWAYRKLRGPLGDQRSGGSATDLSNEILSALEDKAQGLSPELTGELELKTLNTVRTLVRDVLEESLLTS
jgi:hypothetical protein